MPQVVMPDLIRHRRRGYRLRCEKDSLTMRCFNHPEAQAHGICGVCCRGICPDCSADLGHILACRNVHEEQAQRLRAAESRSVSAQNVFKRSIYVAPAFYGFLGLVFLATGLRAPSGQALLPTATAIGFLVFAFLALVLNYRAYVKKTDDGA